MPALPTIPSSSQVLVTGANGYLGTWAVKTLLDRGYRVRAVVRSDSKASDMKALFPNEDKTGQLGFSFVPDLGADGAYDEAVKGVDGVLHLASPLAKPSENPDEIIKPAVNGTVGILKSALKNAQSLKRVVITSSVAAVIGPQSEPKPFDETDWNELAITNIEKAKERIAAGEPSGASPFDVYRASKALAEKAAWGLHKANKSSIGWDIVTLNPPFIYGPPLYKVASPADLGGTQGVWYTTVVGNSIEKAKEGLGVLSSNEWVDVRDVSEAHVRALEKEGAGGERIIVSAGPYIWQEWIDLVNKLLPTVAPDSAYSFPKGYPELTKSEVAYSVRLDTRKGEKILGVKFRSMEETTRDILVGAAEQGWI